MTNEQIRITIAEKLGYKRFDSPESTLNFYLPDGKGACICPDYPESLDACREFERTLYDELLNMELYAGRLVAIASGKLGKAFEPSRLDWFHSSTALPIQRCEEFLRLHGLWKDESTPAPKVEGGE